MSEPPTEKSSTALALFKLLLFTVFVPGTVTVWAPLYFFRSAFAANPGENPAFLIVGTLLIAAGAAGYLWCSLDFAFAGRGTPAPIDPPKDLVVRGLYRYARNPMYISVLLVLFGESVVFRSERLVGYALAAGVAFQFFVVLYEEPQLRGKFGASYEEYCKRVNRWLPGAPRS